MSPPQRISETILAAYRWCWRCQRWRSIGSFNPTSGPRHQCTRCAGGGPRGAQVLQRAGWVITDKGRAALRENHGGVTLTVIPVPTAAELARKLVDYDAAVADAFADGQYLRVESLLEAREELAMDLYRRHRQTAYGRPLQPPRRILSR